MASPQNLARHYVRRPSAGMQPMKTATTKDPRSSNFAWMKHGIGKLTATVDGGKSRLTQVLHKAPMRWLPLLNCSRVEEAGAAVAAMSNYGAGLLPGDVQEIHLQVDRNARLAVVTQGSNRIYKRKTGIFAAPAKSALRAQVDEGGFLVIAPDPTACFAASSFVQKQQLLVHPNSSVILLDWFSSGRFANGERWQAAKCSSQTQLKIMGQQENEPPLVWDATTLDRRCLSQDYNNQNPFGFDLGNQSFNAYASMILYGEQSMPVVEQLQALQQRLAGKHTRLRRQDRDEDDNRDDLSAVPDTHDLGTTGRVLLGVNKLDVHTTGNASLGPVHMARWVASSNEDLYRTLHHVLKPLAPQFGVEFYKDRIRATSSGPLFHHQNDSVGSPSHSNVFSSDHIPNTPPLVTCDQQKNQNASTSWSAYMLADSALPTGSFAHSSGLESASQLGLIRDSHNSIGDDSPDESNNNNVELFIQASTRSTLQQSTPWIMAGHDLAHQYLQDDKEESLAEIVMKWERLDRHVHSIMVCNAPACLASVDQGRNSLRVALPWFQKSSSPQAYQLVDAIQKCLAKSNSSRAGHIGPIYGILGSALKLQAQETCQLFGYCVARDVSSAAVRLNLIGPLASAAILAKAQSAAIEGIQTSLEYCHDTSNDFTWTGGEDFWGYTTLGGCAPVVEAVHPVHDLLAVRLFRT